MVIISRWTELSDVPISLVIETEITNGMYNPIVIPGPYFNITIPGTRVTNLVIPQAGWFQVVLVTTDGEEIIYTDLCDRRIFARLSAITISDGMVETWAPIGGYTYRPPYMGWNGTLYESGYSMLIPAYPSYGPPLVPQNMPPVPQGMSQNINTQDMNPQVYNNQYRNMYQS